VDWKLTISEANRLADSFWNDSPPALAWDYEAENLRMFISTIFDYLNEYWKILHQGFKSFNWKGVEAYQLLATQERAWHFLHQMFLEIPDSLKPKANFADARFVHTLCLFLEKPLADAFEQIGREMQLIQCGLWCSYEFKKRCRENPIGHRTALLKMSRDYDFPLSAGAIYGALLASLRPFLNRLWLPHEAKSHQQDGKDAVIHTSITKLINTLDHPPREVFKKVIEGQLEKLGRTVRNDAISELRKQTAAKRQPASGIQSLEEHIQPIGITLQSENEPEALKEEPRLTAQKQERLREVLGSTAFKIFEIQLADASLTAQQIANLLDLSPKTINRNRQKIREHRSVIETIIWD